MKKRILSLVLALSMMISLFPVSALAQTPGGGGVVLAEENGTTATPIEITIDSDGKPTTEGDGTNWEYEDNLTLKKGTYTFSAPVTCGVIIYNGATVAGGTFEGTVWNEPGGKISGGTFKKAVSNKGVIESGTFTGEKNDDSKDTTCAINYDAGKITSGAFYGTVQNDGVITGGVFLQSVYYGTNQTGKVYSGVFKSVPYGEVDATIQRVLDARKPGILKVKTDEKMDFAELNYTNSGFFVIMPTIGERPVLWVQFCNENGEVVDITNLNGKPIGTDTYNSSWDDATKILTFTMPRDAHVMLNGYIKTLEIDRNGKPLTEDRWCYNGVYSGDGWAYYPSKGENGLLSLSNTSGNWNFTDKAIQCDVKVNNGATVTGGTFYKNVENNGTVKNSAFYGTVTNKDSGKMENVAFVGCEKLTNSGNITGAVVRADGGNITFSNTGTIDNAVFDFNEGIERARELKEANGKAITVGVVGCKYYVFISDNVKKLYVVGTPKLDVRINDNTLIANINGDVNYGNLTPEKTAGYQQFTVQSGNGDIVLNQIGAPDPSEVKHKLTLTDAVIVNANGSTDTTGEYKEGITVKIKPQIDDSKKIFSRWSTDPDGFEAIVPNDDTEGTYTLTMPGYNLSVRAESTYRSYPLTVVGGTFKNTFGNMVEWGNHVTVKANVPYGKYFAGWEATETGTGVALTLRDWSGKVIDLMDENLTTLRFPMPDKAVTLTAVYKDCEKKLVMKADGTPDLTHVYKENGRRYVGDGWWYFSVEDGSEVNALYLSPDALTEYDFAHTDPIGKTGTLEAVNCIIVGYNANATIVGGTFAEEVDNRGTIWNGIFKGKVYNGDVPYSATIKNGTFMGEVINSNNSTITGGIFAGGVKRSGTDVISGGVFNEGTALKGINGAHKIVLEGAQILSINGVSRANGWSNVYAFAETELTVEASQSIYNVNGETTGATGLKTSTIKFTMSDEDAVLNKDITSNPTPNPDDQPTTYTVTVKGGKINGKTEVKAEKDTKLTVDVDEKEVPEGMTFDVWSIRFPKGVEDTLTPSVNLHDPHMTFTMPVADITIEAQYRSSELPGEDDGPSALGTMATVAVGGAAAGILVWQGVSLGVDSYLQLNLPKGAAVPANRRELVKLLWETAGKPETALPSLYSDLPAEEIELQKATRWAIDSGLVKSADDNDASRFDPDRYVTKYDVFGAWLKLKKLMK